MTEYRQQQVELDIIGLTDKGDGIGQWQGRKIFVPGALAGERVAARLHGIKPGYAQAELIEVLQPLAERVPHFCPHTECGGCQIPVLAYEAQLRLKQQQVQAVLAARGLAAEVQPCIGMDEPYRYRNKALYAVRAGADGLELGFFRKLSHALVACDDCGIQHPQTGELVRRVRTWARRYGIQPYDEQQHSGQLRYLMLRHGEQSGEWMLVLVTLGEALPHVSELLAALSGMPGLTSVLQNINPARGNRILGPASRLLQGEPVIEDRIDGLRFHISPLSFFQVNPRQTGQLYAITLQLAGLSGQETVFDLYCGIGTISLSLARQAKRVIGVELVAEAIEDARHNAALNELTNAEFHVGKAEEVVPALYAEGVSADVVVVDPPRKGCDARLLETMLAMAPRTLVYVSCDPGTLARDLAFLTAHGYRLERVQPVDMFPHTLHVETVARLVRV